MSFLKTFFDVQADIPSVVGVLEAAMIDDIQSEAMDVGDENKSPMMNGHAPKKGKDYKIDETSIRVPRAGMEMASFLKDGMSMFL